MSDSSERMHILEMIESGKISAEQGMQLIAALDSAEESEEGPILEAENSQADTATMPDTSTGMEPTYSQAAPKSKPPTPPHLPQEINKWRRFWVIPLAIGIAVTILSSYWMYTAQQASGIGFSFLCASLPFLIGLAILALAWKTRRGPWLHLRIQQKPGEHPQRIALSFPLPIRLAAWFLKRFGNRIEGLENTSLDEVILAVGDNTSPENPVYVQVDEGEDGEKVEIFIG